MAYQIKKCWNVIFNISTNYKLDLEDEIDGDVTVLSFSTLYDAQNFYDKMKDFMYTIYKDRGINEMIGNKSNGYASICYTDYGPYLYVRLQGCDFMSSSFRVHEYFDGGK